MDKIQMINEQFGNSEYVQVTKPEYVGRTLTRAIFDVSKRIDQTIDALSEVNDIRKIRAGSFRTPMCKKKKGNLVVKVGYGSNNHIMDTMLGEQKFANASDALAYLFKIRSLLREGGMDDIIEHHLDVLKARSEYARQVRAGAKKITSMDNSERKRIEHMREIGNHKNVDTAPSSLSCDTKNVENLQFVEEHNKAA